MQMLFDVKLGELQDKNYRLTQELETRVNDMNIMQKEQKEELELKAAEYLELTEKLKGEHA